MSGEIVHYGVKGMKWGVRKEYKNSQKNLLTESKPRMDINTKRVLHKPKTISDSEYSKLSSKDHVIKKGSELTRITKNANSVSGNLYVSTNEDDAEIYRAALVTAFPGQNVNKVIAMNHEVTLKAMTDIRSPSEKVRVDAFAEILSDKSVTMPSGNKITGREYLEKSGFKSQLKDLDNVQAGRLFYDKFVIQQGNQRSPINSAYFNKIKERGYNAVIDDNDRGLLSKDPWIILDAQNTLTKVRSKQLTREEVIRAKAGYKQIQIDERFNKYR